MTITLVEPTADEFQEEANALTAEAETFTIQNELQTGPLPSSC